MMAVGHSKHVACCAPSASTHARHLITWGHTVWMRINTESLFKEVMSQFERHIHEIIDEVQ
jgi:hypothetical protein